MSVRRLNAVRARMRREECDLWLLPYADPHFNEYQPAYWRRIEWLTGFTGSNATVLVGHEIAYLWTDSRYWLQAEQELKDSGFELMRQGAPGVLSPEEWLFEHVGMVRVVVDARQISVKSFKRIAEKLTEQGCSVDALSINPLDDMWTDRPPMPSSPVQLWPEEISGLSVADKLAALREKMSEAKCQNMIELQLDNIAWLLNIRGSDIPYNPLIISALNIGMDRCSWYVLPRDIPSDVRDALGDLVEILPYSQFEMDLPNAGFRLCIDPDKTTAFVHSGLEGSMIKEVPNLITALKALKTPQELKSAQQAHVIDGVAVTRFLYWLSERALEQGGLTEFTAARQLEAFRSEHPDFMGPSFETISGFAENGAIVHYAVKEASAKPMDDSALYLVDSGGQYETGTTDITRTVHLGTPTEEEQKLYTLVLKGHIALSMAVFPEGAMGASLDALARYPLWQAKQDFGHGTGHGVGTYLCVHEGPQSISPRSQSTLEPGMIVSNEPGVYIEGKFGIRIENLIHVAHETDGRWRHFKTLTLAPYARRLIQPDLLSQEELAWLNDYHQRVYNALSPFLSEEEQQWLRNETEAFE